MQDIHIDIHAIDYGIFAIIAFSVLMGLMRGFVREAMSLITWVTAVTVATLYGETVAGWFNTISMTGVRLILAFVLLVLAVLIIGGVVSHLIGKIIKSTRFSITDRIVGILFGFGRGAVIIALAMVMIKASGVAYDYLSKNSLLIPKLEPVALWLEEKLPDDIKKLSPHFKAEEGSPDQKTLKSPLVNPSSQDLNIPKQQEELQKIDQDLQKMHQDLQKGQQKTQNNQDSNDEEEIQKIEQDLQKMQPDTQNDDSGGDQGEGQ